MISPSLLTLTMDDLPLPFTTTTEMNESEIKEPVKAEGTDSHGCDEFGTRNSANKSETNTTPPHNVGKVKGSPVVSPKTTVGVGCGVLEENNIAKI